MGAAIIILAALALAAALLYAHHRLTASKPEAEPEAAEQGQAGSEADGQCCGMHITCERDSLLAAASPEIIYFDDDELDAYAGREPDSYTEPETEQFRDVLLTLLPDDIAPWARSLQLRGIALPEPVRDELIMIVAEERQKRNA